MGILRLKKPDSFEIPPMKLFLIAIEVNGSGSLLELFTMVPETNKYFEYPIESFTALILSG
jgi:hypothetical protein